MTRDGIGTDEGDVCGRDGCEGTMQYSESEDCSCHITSPCGSCTSTYLRCEECGAEPDDE